MSDALHLIGDFLFILVGLLALAMAARELLFLITGKDE